MEYLEGSVGEQGSPLEHFVRVFLPLREQERAQPPCGVCMLQECARRKIRE